MVVGPNSQEFRQFGSKCPGHPEFGPIPYCGTNEPTKGRNVGQCNEPIDANRKYIYIYIYLKGSIYIYFIFFFI